jgi:hypothetical protein
MTSEMRKRLSRIFSARYYMGESNPSQSPTWNEICSSVGVERRDGVGVKFGEYIVPEGFVDIQDPSPKVPYGRIRMTEETAMKILALGGLP